MNPSSPETTQPKRSRRNLARILAGLFFIAVIVLAYLYIKQSRELARLSDPMAQTEYAQKQVDKAIADLKTYMVIPDAEEVKLLGIINNAEALKKDQEFYANVENGDYVFLFTKSSRALIWRPEAKKIINFGIADTAGTQITSPKPAQSASTTESQKTE